MPFSIIFTLHNVYVIITIERFHFFLVFYKTVLYQEYESSNLFSTSRNFILAMKESSQKKKNVGLAILTNLCEMLQLQSRLVTAYFPVRISVFMIASRHIIIATPPPNTFIPKAHSLFWFYLSFSSPLLFFLFSSAFTQGHRRSASPPHYSKTV